MTAPAPVNVHGTAIVIGTTGLLFTGPSGAGKSMAALHCMTEARARGLFSALVSDDQILVSVEGGRLIARAPVSIAGLAELRGAGIVSAGTIEAAVLHRAIRPIAPPFAERLAPEGETLEVLPGHALPLTRLPEMIQPLEMIESSACPHRVPSSAKTNFAGGACGWYVRSGHSGS